MAPPAARPASPPPQTPIAVVASPEVAEKGLSFAELRRVFLGDRLFWSEDLRVTLLVPAPGSREREALLRSIYQMSEAQYRHYWIAKVFRTEATSPPKAVGSIDMATELVRAIPGAVSLVEASRVPHGLKVLAIDGKRPGDAGYRLR